MRRDRSWCADPWQDTFSPMKSMKGDFHAAIRCLIPLLVCVLSPGVSGITGRAPAVDESHDVIAPCAQEQPVTLIPITGELMTTCGPGCAEVSGLAWYRDNLILLPQYPERFPDAADSKPPTMGRLAPAGGATLFAIPKSEIIAYLDGHSKRALVPKCVHFVAPDFRQSVRGYQGYEAIAFDGDRAILLIEAKGSRVNGRACMTGYIVTGKILNDLSELRIDPTDGDATLPTLTEIPPQTMRDGATVVLPNMAYETVVLVKGTIVTLYEANGCNVNPAPAAHRFDLALRPLQSVSLPTMEYRITDATSADADGRFWVINFFYVGDEKHLKPAKDELITPESQGCTHKRTKTVERLLELQYTATGIQRTDRPPIQLELGLFPRNWEGIVRLDNRGFLLVTDQYPITILGFVPSP